MARVVEVSSVANSPFVRALRVAAVVVTLIGAVAIGVSSSSSTNVTTTPGRDHPASRSGPVASGPSTGGPASASDGGGGVSTEGRAGANSAPAAAPDAGSSLPTLSELFSGSRSVPIVAAAGVAPGSYTLHAQLGGSGRARFTIDGGAIAELSADSQDAIDVPVWIDSPDTAVGVEAVAGGPMTVDDVTLAPSTPTFTTRGPSILDPQGQAYVPRGVNEYAFGVRADGWGFSEADTVAMNDWGVTMVRLQLGEQFAVSQMCNYDPQYLPRIDAAIQWLNSRGIIALLDLHWTTRGDACGTPGLQPLGDDFSIPFWQTVASRYKDNPLVAFDLFNEPHDVSASVWRDGGRVTQGKGANQSTWHAVGMQQLYDTVRGTGARNVVYVTGYSWGTDASPLTSNPLDGWGIVGEVHAYCPSCTDLPPDIEGKVHAIRGKLPLAITEFGSDQDSGTFNTKLIDWAESNGFGWLAYSWAVAPPQEFGLLADSSFAPSRQGAPVKNALQRHR